MSIRVKVYAPAFIQHKKLDADGFATLPDNASLKDLYHHLRVPFLLRPVLVCSVNSEQASQSTPLKDGDTISFFFPISGG